MLPQRLADPFYATAKQYWKNPNGNRAATRYIVIHHAAADYAPGTALDAIFRFHSSRWPDYHAIAYHELIQIEPDGSLRAYQTNPVSIIGAGVWGQNEDTYHICAATNFGATVPIQLWQDAIALRVVEAKRRWPDAQIVGHKDIAKPGHETACPGEAWARWKPALLARVHTLLAMPTNGATRRAQAGTCGAIVRQDYQAGSKPVVYLGPGSDLVLDDFNKNDYVHLASGLGFIASGDVVEA